MQTKAEEEEEEGGASSLSRGRRTGPSACDVTSFTMKEERTPPSFLSSPFQSLFNLDSSSLI